ncbi:phage tail protein [Pseudomonas sp. BF-R-12]|uniref:phage tail protein n=1 Tax=Pseudomonas sp. BF-R-12 TaxID=2832363 RepID=UPI001CBCFEF7|nr:phage tail protein [Pseudomonas sp. BF-R-12]
MIDQSSQFFAMLTNIGVAKQANADALGVPWKITAMAVGHANGTDPMPDATQTSLLGEWRRAPLNQLKVDPNNAGIIVAEQVIPAEVGGYWIREIGLYDEAGDLVAVANCAPSFKPLLNQGSGRTQVVRMNLIVSNSSNVQLKIDPAVVLATREFVTEELAKQDFKHSVLVATTAAIVLSGLQTIDAVALPAGATVLVKNQIAAQDNGLYVVAVGAWVRRTDADSSAKVTPGLLVHVEKGTANGDGVWQLVTDGPITLGVSALAFEMAFGRTGVAVGTYRSVTVDKYGRVVSATNPTTVAGYGLTDVYTVTQIDTALALKANLAAPTFTGPVSVPNVAAGNNSQLAANTAFVQAALAALVASSPASLDTLNELAAALGDDPNFATTITNLLALKSPLASPAFTGAPTGPTPALFDNTLKFATTEFVKRMGMEWGSFSTVSVSTVLGNGSVGSIVNVGSATPINLTFPPTAPIASGGMIKVVNGAAGAVTLLGSSGELFTNLSGSAIAVVLGQGDSAILARLTGEWRLVGGSVALKHASVFATSLAANGHHKLPSGLIIQWGTAGTSNGFGTWTYPIAFPNAVFRVFASNDATASGASMYACGAHPSSGTPNTSATIASQLATGGDAIVLFAIGY